MNKIIVIFVLSALILVGCTSANVETQPPAQPTAKTNTIPATPTKPTVATTTPATTPTLNPPTPTQEPTVPARRSVFLISWDAGRADIVYDLMARGLMPNFANMADNGLRAEYAQSIDPSLTAPAHNSMATGCYPSKTGIVSNSFHDPADSFYWYRSGFDEPLDDAEPVWVSASRAGLTSAVLFFPGGTPDLPWQTADYTIAYGVRDAYSRQKTITLYPSSEEWTGATIPSYSTPYEASFTIPEVARVYVFLTDSSDDGVSNHDTIFLNTGHQIADESLRLTVNQWGTLLLDPSKHAGADFLIQKIELDETSPQVTLFHSGINHNNAAPRELLESLNKHYGFPPADADEYALEHGWISEEEFLHMLERASLWRAQVSGWVFKTYQPDLLMTWQNNLDSAGHAFFLQDPRQPGYSEEKTHSFIDYYQRAAIAADQALDTMLDVIDLETTTLLMVADHGMAPIHTSVYVNTILEKAGLLKLDNRNYVVVDQSKAFAVCSGGSVNVYINLADYQVDGFVSNEEYPQVQAQVIDLLSSLTDPENGEQVFSRILSRQDLETVHLNHSHSGDVFAQAQPGYALDCWRGKDTIFDKVEYYGQHGYESSLIEMQGLFIATGVGVPRSGEVIPPMRLIDIAPTIAALLNFNPDPRIDGEAIPALIDHQ